MKFQEHIVNLGTVTVEVKGPSVVYVEGSVTYRKKGYKLSIPLEIKPDGMLQERRSHYGGTVYTIYRTGYQGMAPEAPKKTGDNITEIVKAHVRGMLSRFDVQKAMDASYLNILLNSHVSKHEEVMEARLELAKLEAEAEAITQKYNNALHKYNQIYGETPQF